MNQIIILNLENQVLKKFKMPLHKTNMKIHHLINVFLQIIK